jgi:hypothetical protein
MSEPSIGSRRRLPPFVGFAVLGFAVMEMARSFDLPVDGRWWFLVGALAVLATISVVSHWGQNR